MHPLKITESSFLYHFWQLYADRFNSVCFVFFIEIHFSNRGCTREGRINNISQCDIIRHRETGRSLAEGTLQCGACIIIWLVKYQTAKKSKLM